LFLVKKGGVCQQAAVASRTTLLLDGDLDLKEGEEDEDEEDD
jgi:hypothetical protein